MAVKRKLILGTDNSEWISGLLTQGNIEAGFTGVQINAGLGNDGLGGTALHDLLRGQKGNDQLHGFDGDDSLYGGQGNDSSYGGDGNDTLCDVAGHNVLFGGNGDDRIKAGGGNDTIGGDAGHDVIKAGNGNNVVWAGIGDDTVMTGVGNDSVTGDSGNDTVLDFGGKNTVHGGSGDDTILSVGHGRQFITGDDGNDVISVDGRGQVYGGSGDDLIRVSGGRIFVTGDAGNDTISHLTDNNMDTLYAGDGNDLVSIGWGEEVGAIRDIVSGGSGHDTLRLDVGTDFASVAFQAQLAAYRAHLATPGGVDRAFDLSLLGASVSGFEQVQATGLLTFEEFPLNQGAEQPLTSYAGFEFEQIGVYAPDGSLGYRAVGNTLGFFGEAGGFEVPGYDAPAGSPIVMRRADGGDFSLVSGVFSSAFVEDLQVTVEGYNNGVLMQQTTLTVIKGMTDLEALNLVGVDEVRFDAANYFGFDDLSVIA